MPRSNFPRFSPPVEGKITGFIPVFSISIAALVTEQRRRVKILIHFYLISISIISAMQLASHTLYISATCSTPAPRTIEKGVYMYHCYQNSSSTPFLVESSSQTVELAHSPIHLRRPAATPILFPQSPLFSIRSHGSVEATAKDRRRQRSSSTHICIQRCNSHTSDFTPPSWPSGPRPCRHFSLFSFEKSRPSPGSEPIGRRGARKRG